MHRTWAIYLSMVANALLPKFDSDIVHVVPQRTPHVPGREEDPPGSLPRGPRRPFLLVSSFVGDLAVHR